MSYWNKPGRIEQLKKLWASGLSASAIAQKLGDNATRNSVIGKVHRLKLDARSVSQKSSPKVNTENQNTPEVKTQKTGRKARFKALLIDKTFPEVNPTKIEDLTDQHCRWPLGEKMEPASFFCGRVPMEKFVYCKLHMLFAYQPKNAKEEDLITDEDIPQFIIEKKVKSS